MSESTQGDGLRAARINLPRIFRLVWEASPGGASVMAVLAVGSGLILPGLAWYMKLLVDRIVILVDAGGPAWDGTQSVIPLLAGILVLLLAGSVIGQGNLLAEKHLRIRLRYHITNLIMVKAQALDLSYFENAEYYDHLQNARQEADQRALNIVVQTFRAIQQTITILTFTALLVRFSPWLILIMLGTVVPSFAMQQKYSQLSFRILNRRAPERREMTYYEDLLTMDQYVKEVKLFGLGPELLRRYDTHFNALFREDFGVAWRQSIVSVIWSIAGLLGFLFAMGWIIYRMLEGTITFGDGILYLEAFRQSHLLAQTLLLTLVRLMENSLFIGNIFTFLALEPATHQAAEVHPLPGFIREGIEFHGVSFRYPGHEDWVLRDINLAIRPGEKLALVGLNGAGKTTLVKLLAGLYPPTQGDILVDGISLSQCDPAAWQQKVGVIFQDFVRYQFSAAENIGVGQIDRLTERDRIIEAARKGGVDTLIEGLPSGYETRLGRRFENGHELSLGQWQKVALSRAFMRESEIIILDEPTAALDAEQEARVFRLFHELTEGKTALLISHRFSTVRIADRIVVLSEGRIKECDSHAALMAADGIYAHLFNLQAASYQDE